MKFSPRNLFNQFLLPSCTREPVAKKSPNRHKTDLDRPQIDPRSTLDRPQVDPRSTWIDSESTPDRPWIDSESTPDRDAFFFLKNSGFQLLFEFAKRFFLKNPDFRIFK